MSLHPPQKVDLQWFRTKQEGTQYKYTVYVRSDLRPETVDPETYGHHRSFVCRPGLRLWAFHRETGRTQFLTDHSDYVKGVPK